MSDERNDSSSKTKKNGLNTTQVIMIVGIVLILGALGAVVYLIVQNQKVEPLAVAEPKKSYVINKDNLEQIQKERAEKVNQGMFRMKMNTTWNFASGDVASSDATVQNSESNQFPFFFEITLPDTGEIIYTSTVIPVGSAIKEVILDKQLAAGTYETVCKYNMLDDKNEIVDNVSVNVSIIVKN